MSRVKLVSWAWHESRGSNRRRSSSAIEATNSRMQRAIITPSLLPSAILYHSNPINLTLRFPSQTPTTKQMVPAPRHGAAVLLALLLSFLLVATEAAAGAATATGGGGAGAFFSHAAHHRRSRASSVVAVASLLPAAHQRGRSRHLAMASSKPFAAFKALASRYSDWLVRT